MTAAEIAAAVGAGELDPAAAVEESLRALEERAELNAVISLCPEQALARARTRPSGPLAGVPLLVKDLFDTAGVRTTYGSTIYADHVPTRTATAVRRLEEAGAIVVGKANLHEFAWGVTSQNPHYGTVQNPRFPGRTTGGSSGGNAAALAAGLCALGLGTDTGCSVRLPSACCGTVGFKPTWGAVPMEGCYPLCPSFDTAGPMARTVADVALAFSVLTGAPVPKPRLGGLTLGLLLEPPPVEPVSPIVKGSDPHAWGRSVKGSDPFTIAVCRVEALGARVVEARIPAPEVDTWPLFLTEAAASHRATFPARRHDYGDNVRGKLELAQRADPAAAELARRAVARWRRDTATEPAVDLFLCPTLGIPVPPVDVDELEYRLPLSVWARPFNVLGWAGLALGDLQLVGRDDATVLAAGLALEEAHGSEAIAVPPEK